MTDETNEKATQGDGKTPSGETFKPSPNETKADVQPNDGEKELHADATAAVYQPVYPGHESPGDKDGDGVKDEDEHDPSAFGL